MSNSTPPNHLSFSGQLSTEKISLIGIACDANSSYKTGSAKAPPLIRAAFSSDSSNYWSENTTDLNPKIIFDDFGDLVPRQGEEMVLDIEVPISKILSSGSKVIVLGGDHSITYPVIQAFSKYYNSHLSILHLDAHPDLYDNFSNNPFSHASPFARIMENGLVKILVQVGIRTMTGHQLSQVERFGVEVIQMKDWNDSIKLSFNTPVYLSFDMDCLDPAFAPGVSHWEPGGFSTRQVINIIQSLNAQIIGADIVEFNPQVETGMTAMVAAKILKELSSKMLEI